MNASDSLPRAAANPVVKDVLFVLATYNEIENLPSLVDAILATVPDADVLIVDDNSPDGTGEWAQRLSQNDLRVKALIRRDERGLGSAVVAGLRFAVENGYRRVVNMDADFSHPVEVAPRLLARLDGETAPATSRVDASQPIALRSVNEHSSQPLEPVDVVIGSRYVPGGATPDWPLRRRVMSRCVNAYARLTLGLRTKDNSGSYRCYRVETLRKIDFDAIVSKGYSFFEELLYRLRLVDARFAEIPIVFIDRRFGFSKINRKEALRAVAIMTRLGVARLFRTTNRRKRRR
ncbi:MAG: polyprenol monophosphomannose synthase [Thermoguttaceae bacterium]|nr:polyprenol monophosphomannose synthase [Thermoguttaceae bacterium]MBQ7109834.1 polyprenol monophosphomannose synthase [Thermoguttaceae bacterium]